MADPARVSASFRRVAKSVADSNSPDPARAVRLLDLIAARMDGVDTMDVAARKIASAMVRVALEELEVSLWDSDDGTAVDDAYKAAKGKEEAEDLESALKLLRRKVDRFIQEIAHPSPESGGHDSDVFTSAP